MESEIAQGHAVEHKVSILLVYAEDDECVSLIQRRGGKRCWIPSHGRSQSSKDDSTM